MLEHLPSNSLPEKRGCVRARAGEVYLRSEHIPLKVDLPEGGVDPEG